MACTTDSIPMKPSRNVRNESKLLGELLIMSVIKSDSEKVLKFLSMGADPNYIGNDGISPLINCVLGNKAEIAKILMEHGAHVTRATRAYKSPIELVMKKRCEKKVKDALMTHVMFLEMFSNNSDSESD